MLSDALTHVPDLTAGLQVGEDSRLARLAALEASFGNTVESREVRSGHSRRALRGRAAAAMCLRGSALLRGGRRDEALALREAADMSSRARAAGAQVFVLRRRDVLQ